MVEPQDRKAETEALISQATEDVRDRQKRRAKIELAQATVKPSRQRASLAALVAAVPIFVALLIVGFTDWSLAAVFERRPTEGEAREQAERTLNGLVAEIEAFRHDYKELPDGLIEIGIPERGEWTYLVLGHGHYSIQGKFYGQRVSFDSTRKQTRTAED